VSSRLSLARNSSSGVVRAWADIDPSYQTGMDLTD
jgi:hypothetical protein